MLSKLNPQKESQRIVSFIKKTVYRENFSRVVIACSGGIDSSLVLTLATKALGGDNVLALKLPFTNQSMILANLAVSFAGIIPENIFEMNIKEPAQKIIEKLTFCKKEWNLRQGNVLARLRMIYLYDLAKAKKVLVCGTENKSEYLLGYFTRFGDEAADLNPISHLYKTYIILLAKYLELPHQIIEAIPSAGLWLGQTDEEELGFSYEAADQIIYLYCDKKLSKSEIVKKGFDKNLVEKIIKRVKENEFKHKVPYGLNTKT